MSEQIRQAAVVIIGTGFGAMAAAANLRRRGIDDFLLLERRSFMGGTWQQNSYPGAAVDVQSPLYSLSFEPYPWSRMFAGQPELAGYTERVIARHGLAERTVLGAEVAGLEWDEPAGEWLIKTRQSGEFRGQFVINATGPLSTPVVPDFPGKDSFAGPAFHTNDWDHSVPLAGARIAVVGSGASAAQVIPAIQPEVAELHVFQRSPHWVMPRPDREFSPFQRRLVNAPVLRRVVRAAIYAGLETRIIGFKYSERMLNMVARRRALKLISSQVADPELRRKVTPGYTIGCKRIILSNAYYPALAAGNTTLHDAADGIDRIDREGIWTVSGRHIPVDAIVWSTGYDATDGLIPYPVTGRAGCGLAAFWADFPRAYLGTTVPGFPNLFLVTGPNTGIGHTSAIFVIEAQMEYIMRCIGEVRARGATAIEVSEAAEAKYTRRIHAEMEQTVWKRGGCNSWYQSRDGHVTAMFPGFTFTYRRWAKRLQRSDHLLTWRGGSDQAPGAVPEAEVAA
ncbi:MAG: NAD(P)/FAD-dependent oxidoreductase [Renibacterium salmoninarum]|nr:NAD(P)/FAD-dependent oxidoreductase [Renibacterium salmoninarum]